MRSIKGSIYGYARRQARRDFNRSFNSYYKNRNTNQTKEELTGIDVLIGGSVIFGWIMLFIFLCSIGN